MAPTNSTASDTCWCGSSAPAASCCQPILAGQAAPTAEALMRSRYSAYAIGDADYVLASWHPDTRPVEVDLSDGLTWRKLQIVDTVAGGPDDAEGVVEFRAAYREPDGTVGLLHERSRFARIDGRWVYVDGDTLD